MNNNPLQPTNTKYLTVGQVSGLFNIKESRVRSMIFYKQIPHLKIGASIRFNLNELNEWIKSKEIEARRG